MSSITEVKELLDFGEAAWARGTGAALAVITAVKGSAYRRPGAKILLTMDNRIEGTLSGGCLEGDLYLRAERVIADQAATLVHYDLAEDALWGLGIGCQGALDVLVLPIAAHDQFWHQFRQIAANRQPTVWIQELPAGRRSLWTWDQQRLGDALPEPLWSLAASHVAQRLGAKTVALGADIFFLDTLLPAPRLVVSGAGHDAVPMVRLAASVGFEVTVLDPRSELNRPECLPQARRHLVLEPDQAQTSVPSDSFWLIMNHHLERDRQSIQLALGAFPRWVGILGPRQRTEQMLGSLGLNFHSGPIVSPIGLDLGSETPDEVAISVVAQLLAADRQKDGKPLHGRYRIHS